MTRIMLDALNPNNIPLPLPLGATMVAGYLDLNDAWSPQDFARFEDAGITILGIVRNPSDLYIGDVLDVESGLATPAEAPNWVAGRRAHGLPTPIVYCSTGIWTSVIQQFNLQQVPQPQYWVAAYPGAGPTVPGGAIGHQYEDLGPYDVSVMADYIEGIDAVTNPFYDALTSPMSNVTDPTQQNPTTLSAEFWLKATNNWAADAASLAEELHSMISDLQTQVTELSTAVSALTGLGTLTGTASVAVTLTPKEG